MAVDIGRLNKRVTFFIVEQSVDEMEQDCVKWKEHCTVWATVTPVKSNEIKNAGKVEPEVSYKIYIRYRKDIETNMNIRYSGKILEMTAPAIDLDERHELLEIQAKEKLLYG